MAILSALALLQFAATAPTFTQCPAVQQRSLFTQSSTDLHGKPLNFSRYAGSVSLVVNGATW